MRLFEKATSSLAPYFICFILLACNHKPEVKPESERLVVSPNPVFDMASIYVSSEKHFTLQVFNPEGKKIFEQTNQPSGMAEYNIKLTGQPKGSYQAILSTSTDVYREKFIKI